VTPPSFHETNRTAAADAGATLGRRQLVSWLAGGALGGTMAMVAVMASRFMTPALTSPQPQPAVVPPSLAPAMSTMMYLSSVRAYLIQDDLGYYAVSATCTHLGCLLDELGAEFQCPCHGSRFGTGGENLNGPALYPLPHFAVTHNEAGDLVVDPNISVAADMRLPATIGSTPESS
jgi:cytochrome b6-f complex iron-sulfur subunit